MKLGKYEATFPSTLENKHLAFLFFVFFTAVCTTFLLRELFYLASPWIWAQNIHHPVLMPTMEEWKHVESGVGGRDGIEIYVLYLLMFLNIGCVFLIAKLTQVYRLVGSYSRTIIGLMALFILFYIWHVGINFPMTGEMAKRHGGIQQMSTTVRLVISSAVVVVVGSISYTLTRLKHRHELPVLLMLLLPTCFIATGPVSDNSGFIFLPALQIAQGAPLNEIYFQYDIFLSLLALAWTKAGLSMASIQTLGQLSFLLAILLTYFLSKKLFANKTLSVVLLCTLILIRLYAGPGETAVELQGSPLRLDLWLILLGLVYLFGPFHWSLGVAYGLLVIFHRNFGLIYSAAYLQLITVLICTSLADRNKSTKLRTVVFQSISKFGPTLLIIIISVLLRNLYFGENTAADYYRSIGIGFTKISPDSIYWFFPIIIATSAVLLVGYRRHFSQQYYVLALFLITLSVGNSLYFMGRSHEWNLLTLSISLLFMLFLFVDITWRVLNSGDSKSCSHKKGIMARYPLVILVLFFSTISWAYAPTIHDKLLKQIQNVRMSRIHMPSQFPDEIDYSREIVSKVHQLIDNKKDIEFFELDSSLEYYLFLHNESGSKAFFRPSETWLFEEDFHDFLFRLLERDGYALMSHAFLRIFPVLGHQFSTITDLVHGPPGCNQSWSHAAIPMRIGRHNLIIPDMDFANYVDSNQDLRTAYGRDKSTLTKSEWGEIHFHKFGKSENRLLMIPICMTPIGNRYLLISAKNI